MNSYNILLKFYLEELRKSIKPKTINQKDKLIYLGEYVEDMWAEERDDDLVDEILSDILDKIDELIKL